MQLIQHITLTGSQASIEFTGIPATFDDLLLVVSPRGSVASALQDLSFRFNGVTSGYSARTLSGTGSSVNSYSEAFSSFAFTMTPPGANATANTFGNGQIYIANYKSSVAKSVSIDFVGENNATVAAQKLTAGLWDNTAAITSINLFTTPDLVAGTSASLYGIRRFNTTTQPKATGGVISFDAVNNKWVHVFTASGTFTPTENLTGVEYLVVAGGGGGGGGNGGGGGAGGYRSSVIGQSSGGGASAESTVSISSGVGQTVTIGSGGAAGANAVRGGNGNNSVFGSITATGGGGGGSSTQSSASGVQNGNNGGSGGGAGIVEVAPVTAGTPGSGTSNQGFAGGNSVISTSGGGGGGAGAVGGNAPNGVTGGNGGAGVASPITGTSLTYAAGGGGTGNTTGGVGTTAVSGNGGGGDPSNGTSAPANRGGGGGGARGGSGVPGAGGSGIVIVRYS